MFKIIRRMREKRQAERQLTSPTDSMNFITAQSEDTSQIIGADRYEEEILNRKRKSAMGSFLGGVDSVERVI